MRTAFVPLKEPQRAALPPWPAAVAPEGRTASAFRQVPTAAISIPAGIRDDVTPGSVSELADNLRSVGMLQPIIVRSRGPERFELVVGERRLRAARLAELDVVPAMVVSAPSACDDAVSLFENIHRENLSLFEEARVLERLLGEHGSLDGVSRVVNKSKAWISERLQLLTLGPAARRLADDGVTSDVDVLNAVNRAARLDPEAAHRLAGEIRGAEKKRDVARRGLEVIRREATLTIAMTDDVGSVRREVGRLAAEILRIGSGHADPATRARQFRQVLSCSDNGCRDRLRRLLESTFAMGRAACDASPASLNEASGDLVELLHAKPRHLQQLMIRAYSVAAQQPVFDFQQVAIG